MDATFSIGGLSFFPHFLVIYFFDGSGLQNKRKLLSEYIVGKNFALTYNKLGSMPIVEKDSPLEQNPRIV